MEKQMTLLPILDVSCALSAMGGDTEVYRQTVRLFLKIAPKMLSDMDCAFSEDDLATVRDIAHTIKSSSRTIGGMLIGETAEMLEQKCDIAQAAEIDPILHRLHDLYTEITISFSSLGYR